MFNPPNNQVAQSAFNMGIAYLTRIDKLLNNCAFFLFMEIFPPGIVFDVCMERDNS